MKIVKFPIAVLKKKCVPESNMNNSSGEALIKSIEMPINAENLLC